MRTHIFAAAAACALAACAAAQSPEPPAAAPVPAEFHGDAQRGLAYARASCASCHAVEVGHMLSPAPQAPAFEELASTPGMTGRALRAWLNSPHETMPHLIVDPDAVDDLAAYLAALERMPDDVSAP